MLWEFFFKLPMHNTVCCLFFFFFKEFIISSKLEFNCNKYSERMTFFLKQHTFYIQHYCFDELMPTNVVSIVSRFFEQLYSLYGQPNAVCP